MVSVTTQAVNGKQDLTVSTDWFTVVLQDAQALAPVITSFVPAILEMIKGIQSIFNPNPTPPASPTA